MKTLLLVLLSITACAQVPDTLYESLDAVEVVGRRLRSGETDRSYIRQIPDEMYNSIAKNALEAMNGIMGIEVRPGGIVSPFPSYGWGHRSFYINQKFKVPCILWNGAPVTQAGLLRIPVEKIQAIELIKRGHERLFRHVCPCDPYWEDRLPEVFNGVICLWTRID